MNEKENFKKALRTLVGTLAAQGNMGLVPPVIYESIMEECPEHAKWVERGLNNALAKQCRLLATFYLFPDGGRTIRHEVEARDLNHDEAYIMAKGMVYGMTMTNKHPKVGVEIRSDIDPTYHDDFSVDTIDCS